MLRKHKLDTVTSSCTYTTTCSHSDLPKQPLVANSSIAHRSSVATRQAQPAAVCPVVAQVGGTLRIRCDRCSDSLRGRGQTFGTARRDSETSSLSVEASSRLTKRWFGARRSLLGRGIGPGWWMLMQALGVNVERLRECYCRRTSDAEPSTVGVALKRFCTGRPIYSRCYSIVARRERSTGRLSARMLRKFAFA